MRTRLLAFFLFTTECIFAQFQSSVHANDVDALFSANGFFFADPTYTAKYIVPGYAPGQENNATIFAGGFWMGGIDGSGDLHLAASTYRQTGDDYWPGPIATSYIDESYLIKYQNVWPIDKATIDNHIANWDDVGYLVPDAIANWPGNGDVANGEPAILAPFFDYNNNLMYDPEHGDYPLVRGDKAVFMIFNDAADAHGESSGEPLQVEVHAMAYAFDMPADSALRKTVFMNVSIINRSTENYNDFFFGTFADFDLGAYDDDYVGSDSTLNLFFAYNADPNDGPGFGNYGTYVPAQGVAYLNRPMHMFKYYNNDFSVTGNPADAPSFYNYLQGKWIDGSSQTYGGTGYGGAISENYMFPGHPMDPDAWSEMAEINVTGDRRGLGSIRPVTLNAGDTMCIDMAFITAFAFDTVVAAGTVSDIPALSATEMLFRRTSDVIDFYDTHFSTCPVAYRSNPDFVEGVKQEMLIGMQISPNPAHDVVTISLRDGAHADILYIYDQQGRRVGKFDAAGVSAVQVDIQAYPPGIYRVVCVVDAVLTGVGNFMKE